MADANPSPKSLTWINVSIFVLAILLLAFVCILLSVNLYFQYHNYSLAIDAALKSPAKEAAILTVGISRAFDFAVVKTSATFLGFVLVIFGSAFVLRIAETAYSIDIDSAQVGKVSFQSTSPGLIIATLGVTVIVLSLYKDTEVNFESSQITESGENSITPVPILNPRSQITNIPAAHKPTPTPLVAEPICYNERIDLNDGAKLAKTIDGLVACLKANPTKTISIGVTLGNKRGIKPAMNQHLSERKVIKISKMIIDKGISKTRLTVIANGEASGPDNVQRTDKDTVSFSLGDINTQETIQSNSQPHLAPKN